MSFWKDLAQFVISKIKLNSLLQRMDISVLAEGHSPSLRQPLTVNVQFVIFLFLILGFQESAGLKE